MNRIFFKKYVVPTPIENKTIILLTDIHYYNKREQKYLITVLENLKKCSYDYLCISGDLLDVSKVEEEDWLVNWIKEVATLSKVIIGIGNHELVEDKKTHPYRFNDSFYKKLKKIKQVKVLDNDTYIDGDIRFIGVTLPSDYYYEYRESKSYFVKYMNHTYPKAYLDKYNILLCHTPIPFTSSKVVEEVELLKNVSLVLCGHMHGGLVPKCLWNVMKGRGFVGPFRTILPKGANGSFQKKHMTIVISSGITKLSHSKFIDHLDGLFRKEITIIQLQRKK